MKKFTRLWQVMMLILLSSSIVFAQTTVQDAQKGVGEKDYLLKQKQIEQSTVKVTPDGEKVQDITKGTTLKEYEVANEQQIAQGVTEKTYTSVDVEPGVIPGQSTFKPIDFSQIYSTGATDATLWDNGPFVTQPGVGSGGSDYSDLQDATLGMNTYGFGVSPIYSLADDFEVAGEWTLNTITFYAYQTGEVPPTSTLNFVAVQIWDGDPTDPLSTIVYGDLVTNLMVSSSWTNAWRTLESAPAENRAIMEIVADVAGWVLDGCTYWLEFTIDGTGASGPWAPPVTILGQTTTGNAYQNNGTAYSPTVDVGPQGFPFIIDGTAVYDADDVGITQILSPIDGPVGVAQDVTVVVKNYGTNPQPGGIPVYYVYDGNPPVNEIAPDPGPGFSQSYTFTTGILPTTAGTKNIEVCTALPGDAKACNDCKDEDIIISPLWDCTWEIWLYDDYGDGWNGNTMDVISDGILVLDDIAVPSGSGPTIFSFGVNNGATVSTIYTGTPAQWDYENYYYIYDNLGAEVATDPPLPEHGVNPPYGLTDIPTYCALCPPPTALYADNYTPTTADANWTDVNLEGLYDIVWGLLGFDPDDPLTYTGAMFGYADPFGGPAYSYTMTGFNWLLAPYEFYVRTDCGTDETSPWVGFAPVIPPPPNDECDFAQPVTGPYPVTGIPGTTLGATKSCPVTLDMPSGDVWYAIDLPYGMNTVVLDLCGDALMDNGWIVATEVECSCDLAEYHYAVSWNFAPPCVYDLTWTDIPGPTTLYYPVATGTYQENFTLDVNVIEQLVISNDFFITLDETGGFIGGGGTDYYPGGLNGWYYYPESTFWNIWFYDHPYDITRYKEIHIAVTVDAWDPGFPTYLSFVVNWSTDIWSLIGNPLPEPRVPPLPPLTLPEEDLYIGRELLLSVADFIPGPEAYIFDFVIPDYNPEWVSIDVLGENFVITGNIIHECLPKPDPPPPNDECDDAIFIGGVYPQVVPGTTLGATIDCPDLLAWDAVWYEIDLPYECNFIEIDMCLINEPALNNTGIILMADCSCLDEAIIYSTGTWAVAGNCITELNFLVEGPTTVYYPVMSEPKDDFAFDINVTELYRINGKLTYANGAMTTMQLDEVYIDDGAIVLSTYTDIFGDYLFKCLNPGVYTLGGNTTKAWGGLSMNDVQLARQYVTGQPPGNALSGLHLEAGDVDLDGFVLMNDVQAMRQQFTSQPPGFPPFWIFDDPSVTVGPSATQDFQAICGGDTDGSFVPPPAPPGATWLNPIPIAYPSDLLITGQKTAD